MAHSVVTTRLLHNFSLLPASSNYQYLNNKVQNIFIEILYVCIFC